MDPVRSKIMQMCVRSPCDLSCDCVMRVPLGWCETNSIGLNQHGSAPGKWGHNRREKTKVNTQHKTFHAIATASLTGKKYFIFLEFSTSQKISPATILKFRELFQNKCHTFSKRKRIESPQNNLANYFKISVTLPPRHFCHHVATVSATTSRLASTALINSTWPLFTLYMAPAT